VAERYSLTPALERASHGELEALQGRKLAALIQRAAARDGYYARLFAQAQLDPASIRTATDIRRVPFSEKQAFLDDQQEHPPLGSRALVGDEEIARIAMSGGSSGQGREMVAYTRQDLLVLGRLEGTAFRWGGLGDDDNCVFHVPITNSTAALAFPLAIDAVGRYKYLIGHEGFAERLELMRTHGARGMWGTPSTINGFTESILAQGTKPRGLFPDFRTLVIAAENFAQPWAARIAELWGANVIEGYGATQTHGAYCMASCERGLLDVGERGIMHGFDWSFLLEVLDPETDEPVQPGETGELIVTTLDKRASPAIRFRTRDRIRLLAERCPCGRETTIFESGTIGRYDDMLKVKGSNIWPDQVDSVLLPIEGLREYSGTVVISERGRDEIELRFAARSPELERRLAEEIVTQFKRHFFVTVRAIAVPFEELGIRYGDGGKARRWVDRRGEKLSR
jgi:phenylacetate-CoA ligase